MLLSIVAFLTFDVCSICYVIVMLNSVMFVGCLLYLTIVTCHPTYLTPAIFIIQDELVDRPCHVNVVGWRLFHE